METTFRMGKDAHSQNSEDANNNSDHTENSTDVSSVTGDSDALIKSMRQKITRCCKRLIHVE